eukprot:TRINITY_DN9537_c0_g1_i2.p2 TRINITY_DN9537_c0_g1~~TRINITY_DN9537_c0_g1_i2.p2  ORF type:complete len:296 (+),score=29.24 TRINITY_DN9537_c0_g1_i2:80-967(+)
MTAVAMARAISLAMWLACRCEAIERASLNVLSWSIHWQCGSKAGCREMAAGRLIQLGSQQNADIIVAIEFEENKWTPFDLTSAGLLGWTQVPGSCASPDRKHGDALSLDLAPGFTVLAHGGGCLGGLGTSTRAFAVARVVPPFEVAGCDSLCVIGVHMPHDSVTLGQDLILDVCGQDIATRCSVVAGDWNAPVTFHDFPIDNHTMDELWAQLVPDSQPLSIMAPDEMTCCFPDNKYAGYDDHVATNIAAAYLEHSHVFPYQIMQGGIHGTDTEEHKPVCVTLGLPIASVPQSRIV